ncbi:MAG TPA: hypothetical protein VFB12_31335 [Ktedonobacteraceae bacterium]|nr:hypothetical protein [Ktedonobacteraceae bacterium]
MNHEASQFAQELEQIGRRVLDECRGLPDSILQFPLPLSEPCSLLTLAVQLAHTIDYWVLIQIGDKPHLTLKANEGNSISTFAELNHCYEQWIKNTHTILDGLPDAFMDLFIGTRPAEKSTRKRHQEKYALTARMCLIRALTQCAHYSGQIMLIRKFLDDGSHLFSEVKQEQQVCS